MATLTRLAPAGRPTRRYASFAGKGGAGLTYTAGAAFVASPATLAATATHVVPSYAAAAGLTASPATLASAATFAAPTYAASAGLTASAAMLASSAAHVVPTYAAAAALTASSGALAGSATFTPVFTAAASLAASPASLAAVASHVAPTYTAAASLAASPAALSAFNSPAFAAAADLTTSVAALAVTATHVVPTYAAAGDLAASSGTLAASATHAPPATASVALVASSAALAASAAHVAPAFAGTGSLVASSPTLDAAGIVAAVVFQGVGSLAASPATLAATVAVTPPAYTGLVALVAAPATLASSATSAVATSAGHAALVAAPATLAASAAFVAPVVLPPGTFLVALTDYLGAHPDLIALLGDPPRVYVERASTNAVAPYVLVEGVRLSPDPDVLGSETVTLEANAYAPTAAAARALGVAIVNALDPPSLNDESTRDGPLAWEDGAEELALHTGGRLFRVPGGAFGTRANWAKTAEYEFRIRDDDGEQVTPDDPYEPATLPGSLATAVAGYLLASDALTTALGGEGKVYFDLTTASGSTRPFVLLEDSQDEPGGEADEEEQHTLSVVVQAKTLRVASAVHRLVRDLIDPPGMSRRGRRAVPLEWDGAIEEVAIWRGSTLSLEDGLGPGGTDVWGWSANYEFFARAT